MRRPGRQDRRSSVPVLRRQLRREPARLVIVVLAVAAAVALVLLLTGLRRGIGEQVTIYLDRQPPIVVGQEGVRNFLSQTSVLSEADLQEVRAVEGVADVAAIDAGYAMLELHGERVLSLLIGYDPGERGGPWRLAEGRKPRARGELVVDDVLARQHGLRVGDRLAFRGATLRIVGRSTGTNGFMTPLAFATRETTNALNAAPNTATFLLVTPAPSVPVPDALRRIEARVPGVAVVERDVLATRDRELFVSAFSAPLATMLAIAAVAAILVVSMAVYTSTRDRQREYATLKAIGLPRRGLIRLVSAQAAVLAGAGTAVGIALALAAAAAIEELAPQYLIALRARDAALMALATALFAVLAALAPARYLDRLDPATAFRR